MIELAATDAASGCPWLGLHAYSPSDSAAYFGRTHVVRQLDRLIRERHFVAVVGASGSGKSSLVAAGLAGVGWMPQVIRGSAETAAALEGCLERLHRREGEPGTATRSVIVIDGVEALFQELDFHAREGLFARLLAVSRAQLAVDGAPVEPSVPVVCVIRSDSYGDCAAHAHLSEAISSGHLLLGEPSEEELRRMVVEPSAAYGVTVEADLVEELIDDLHGEAGALPLLSHALTETWALGSGDTLRLDDYRSVGGARGSIARAAERLWADLDADERIGVRELMVDFVDPSSPTLDMGRQRPLSDRASTRGLRDSLVSRLTAARILTIDGGWIRVSHEAVFREWPRLREWLISDRDSLRSLAALADQAETWRADGKPTGSILRGVRLSAAMELADQWPGRLDECSAEFIRESEDQRIQAEAATARVAERERRRSRVLGSALVAACIGLAVALVAASLAIVQRGAANDAQRDARLDALVNRSLALRSTDPGLAMLLAAEADRLSNGDTQSQSAMMSSFTFDVGYLGVQGAPRSIASVTGAYLPDGRVLIANDGTQLEIGALDDLGNGAVSGPPLDGELLGEELVVSADGSLASVVTEFADGSSLVSLFNVMTGEWREPVVVPYQSVNVAVSSDGSLLAIAGGPDAVTLLFDVAGSATRRIGEVDGPSRPDDSFTFYTAAVAFTPGDELVIGYESPELKVVDPLTMDEIRTIVVPAFSFNRTLSLADDGRLALGVGSLDIGNASLVDLADGSVRWALDIADLGVAGCAQSDLDVVRNRLFCADYFGRVIVRDLATGSRTGAEFASQVGRVSRIEISPNDGTLVLFGADQPLIAQWRIDGAGPITARLNPGELIDSFSYDGTYMLASTPDSEAPTGLNDRVRDVASGEVIDELDGFVTARWDYQTNDLFAVRAIQNGWEIVRYDPVEGRTSESFAITMDEFPSSVYVFEGIIVVVDPGGLLLAHSTDDGAAISPAIQLTSPFTAIAATADGGRLIAMNDGGANVYDMATGSLVAGPFPAPTFGVVLPTGELVGADPGGAVSVYDAAHLGFVRPFTRISGLVQDIRFDRDRGVLVLKGGDRRVTVLQWPNGEVITEDIVVPLDDVSFTQISPDGRTLFVGGGANGVAAWSLNPEVWRKQLCEIAGRNMTQAEWKRELGWAGDYRTTCPQYPSGDDPSLRFDGLWVSASVPADSWATTVEFGDQPIEFELRLRDGWFGAQSRQAPSYTVATGTYSVDGDEVTFSTVEGESASCRATLDGQGVTFARCAGSASLASLLEAASILRSG